MDKKEISRIPDLIPEDVASRSVAFVEFLQKYYEFMNQEGMPSYAINNSLVQRDINSAVDEWLDMLYREVGYGYVLNKDANKANILRNLSEIYSAKGSLQSVKVLFRVIFGEEVKITLPKEDILKPSSGNWLSEYSIMATLDEGRAEDIVGKFVEVQTDFPNSPTQFFEVEVKRVERRDNNLYEVFVSRYFSGFFYFGSTIRYNDVEMTHIPTMSQVVNIEDGGAGFTVGEIINVVDYNRETGFNNRIDVPRSYNRTVPVTSRYRSVDDETVDVDVRSDGTRTETIISRTDDGTKKVTNIYRGNLLVTETEFPDGTIEKSKSEYTRGVTVPNLKVNWDAISAALIQLADIDNADPTVIDYMKFLNEYDGQYRRGDVTNGGLINSYDGYLWRLYYLKNLLLFPVSINPQYEAWMDAQVAEWNSRYGSDPNVMTFYSLSRRFNWRWFPSSIYEYPEAELRAALREVPELSNYARGDINNDGVIDGEDMLLMMKYDLDLTQELTQDQINWIEDIILPSLPDGKTTFDAVLVLEDVAGESERTELYDFLFERDPDHPEYIRADINNDGTVDYEDVKLFLRRSAGVDIPQDELDWIDNTIIEPLIGTIYNPLLEVGQGKGGVVRVQEVDQNGAITKLKFQSFGWNYPRTFTTFADPAASTGSTATITFSSNILGVTNPIYVDRKGFLSDLVKLQDNDFYQEFSYVIETGVSVEDFSDILKKTVHPTGMKFFGEQSITENYGIGIIQEEVNNFHFNRITNDLVEYFDAQVMHFTKKLDDEGILSDAQIAYIHKPKLDVPVMVDDDIYNFNKVRSDNAIAESGKEVYEINKPKYDTVINSDNDDYHFTKDRNDIAITSDDDDYHFTKVVNDLVVTYDQINVSKLIRLTEGIVAVERSQITFSMPESSGAGVSDITSPQDANIYSINKSIDDLVEISDTGTLSFYSPYVKKGYFADLFNYAVNIDSRVII